MSIVFATRPTTTIDDVGWGLLGQAGRRKCCNRWNCGDCCASNHCSRPIPPKPQAGRKPAHTQFGGPQPVAGAVYPRTGACAVAEHSLTLLDGGNEFATEEALFKDAKKGDWVFVAACLVAAIFCGVWSVKLGAEHYKARHSATEFSSSHRPAK